MMNRVSCSLCDTENQNLTRSMPERTIIRSKSGAWRMNSKYSSSVQKPITRSTPARLYQDRSNMTISPAAGRWVTYRWKYHWVRSRSLGFSSATTVAPRGLRCSMKRLIVPPLPAASRPSNTITTFCPDSLIQFCSFTSSIWSRRLATSYSERGSRSAYG
jgi:hypothetical protein